MITCLRQRRRAEPTPRRGPVSHDQDSAGWRARPCRGLRLDAEQIPETGSVTPLALFFDLFFVFALTQVTATMSVQLSGVGLLRGPLVVALLWWSWTGYAWLANLVR